jgi:aspartyl-tRNA synthetase
MIRGLFQESVKYDLGEIPVITYADALHNYGSDKPDMRFDMTFTYLTEVAKGYDFGIFDNADSIISICVKGGASMTRKEIDAITDYIKRPQVGAKGMIYCRVNDDGSCKSSVDKFFNQEALALWKDECDGQPGDIILVLSGELDSTQKQLNDLRLHVAEKQDLRDPAQFKACWVVDFPLLEWDEVTNRFHAMHHPFTSPIAEDLNLIDVAPGKIRANAYDMSINGMEVGGGSIRIHDKELQQRMFDLLGFTKEEAKAQFGFLMNAFEYGAPPHGGIAFGFDRLCAILTGTESIRDVIAFPKNNMGRDTMIDAPSPISPEQRKELGL